MAREKKDMTGTGLGWKIVPAAQVPTRVRADARESVEIIQAAVDNFPDAIEITELNGRRAEYVQSGLYAFAMRHPDLRPGFHIKVALVKGKVFVSAQPEAEYVPRKPRKPKPRLVSGT